MYQLVDSCVSCRCHAVQNRFPRQFWARFCLRRPTVSPTTSLAVAASMGYDPISAPSRCSSCELARPRPWQLPSRQPQLLLRAVQQFLLFVFLHEHRDCSLPGRLFIQPAARKASDLSCLLSSSDVRLCRTWVHAVFMPAVNSAKRHGVRLHAETNRQDAQMSAKEDVLKIRQLPSLQPVRQVQQSGLAVQHGIRSMTVMGSLGTNVSTSTQHCGTFAVH